MRSSKILGKTVAETPPGHPELSPRWASRISWEPRKDERTNKSAQKNSCLLSQTLHGYSLFFFFNCIIFFNFTVLYWFCHISKWISHRYTCVPHLNPPPSSLPIPSLWVVQVHQPQASSIVHRTWTGDLFHIWYYTYFNAILPNHPTLSLSHRVQKTVLYISVSFAVSYTGLSLPSF